MSSFRWWKIPLYIVALPFVLLVLVTFLVTDAAIELTIDIAAWIGKRRNPA